MDIESYVMGKTKGYSKGYEDGQGIVIIESGITCTDADNDGNVVITEDE